MAQVRNFPEAEKNSFEQNQSASNNRPILSSSREKPGYYPLYSANVLFKLLKKYSPEDAKQRKARLVAEAKLRAESRPYYI